MSDRKAKGLAYLILLSVIWGVAFAFVRRAVFELAPIDLALTRWFIASGMLLVITPKILKPKVPLQRKDLPLWLLVAFAEVVAYHLAVNYAETIVSAGIAGLLNSLGAVFVVTLSALFLREKVGRRFLLALALAVSGAAVLSLADFALRYGSLLGVAAAVVAPFAYAVYAVGSKPLVTKYGAITVVVLTSLIGTAMLLPFVSGQFFADLRRLSLEGWLSVLYLAVLSTFLGYILMFRLISSRAVSALSIQLYLIPVISVLGGVALLRESVSIFTVVGGALLLLAVSVVTTIRR